MSTGDKSIFAFANRDSLQHKQTRAYSAGAVCIKGGLFYEANNNIPENTTFAEGETGETWKLIGGKATEDWVTGTGYKVGDEVYSLKATWVANTDHTSSAAFTTDITKWDLKSGIINETEWSVDSSGNILPKTKDTHSIGSEDYHLLSAHVQGVNFYDTDGTYMGNIDADTDSLGIYSGDSSNTANSLKLATKNNGNDIEITNSAVEFNKDIEITDGKKLYFKDADSSGNEGVELEAVGNDLGFYGYSNGTRYAQPALTITYDNVIGISNGSKDSGMVMYCSGTDGNNGNIIADSALIFGAGGAWGMYLKKDAVNGVTDWRLIGRNTGSEDAFLGESGNRWSRLYVTNSTSVSSDENLKKDIQDIPNALLDVWFDYVKPKAYRLKKYENGKLDLGVIAQDVIKAFDAANLSWEDWDLVEKGEDGLLAVTYDNLQILEMAAIRRKLGI